jgi:Protein of unknown function DUF86
MLLAASDARAFVGGLDEAAFRASRLHQTAVIRSLEIIGEVAGKVSPATQAARPEIPWRWITRMRHRLIHGYAEIRLDHGGRERASRRLYRAASEGARHLFDWMVFGQIMPIN